MAEAAAVAAINFVKATASYFSVTLSSAQAAAIINTVTYVVASAGVNAYLSSQREFPNQGRALQLGIAPDLPRRWQVGRRGNAGVLVDWFVSGNKNQFLWIVKYLHEGPAAPIQEIVADGRTVWTGNLTHGNSVELTEFRSPDERFRVHFHDGRVGQTAPAELTSNGHVGANYRGTGCAHIIEELKWDPDTLPAPPQMVYISDGSHFYDRRLDGSQGGSGSHRLNNPATWATTKTPAVALDHYLLGNYWPGMTRPRMGVGLDYEDVPYDRFAALANLCEETESSAVYGSQQRYEANGFIEANQLHADIITELCKAMDARPADFGGRVSAISHAAQTAIMTITDEDLEETGTEIYDPKRSWAQLVGGAQGSYQDPANNFQPAEYPRVEDPAWEAEDGGETKTASLPLPFETNAARAQRLARLFVNRERRQATLGGKYHPRTIELEEGDWFIRQGARFPSGKVFEVVEPPQLDPKTLAVTISALEVDPTDSAWDTVNELAPDNPVGDTNNSPPSLPVPNVTFSVFSWSHQTFAFSSVSFNHTEFADAPLDIDIELATSNGAGAPDGDNIIDVKIAAGRQYSSYAGLLPNRSYVVRVRARGATRRSEWSDWSTFNSSASGQYGAIGGGDATLGVNVYREDGITVVGDSDVITPLGIAAGFTGQGGLATLNNFSWGSGLLTGIPGELNDGRITAGLNSAGDLNRNIPASRLDSSNVLRRNSGGLFLGDLTADVTGENISAGITGQTLWATYGTAPGNFVSSISAGNALNQNAKFLDPSYAGGIPPGWSDWSGGASLSRGTFYSRPVVNGDASSSAVVNRGLSKYIYNLGGARKFKARIVWRRNGGSYSGSGMHITVRNSANTNLQTVNINCATEAPVGGVVSSVHDGIQVWEKVFDAPAATDRILFYPMWAWSGFAVPADGNGLSASLLECSITPLDETERRTSTQTDFADVTLSNIAAGITGQGWGATATQSAADNNYNPIGSNFILDPQFRRWGDGAYWGSDGNAPLTVAAPVGTVDGSIAFRVTGNFTTNNTYRRIRTPYVSGNGVVQGINVTEGDRIGARALVGFTGGVRVDLYIEWRNEVGSWVGSSAVQLAQASAGTGQGRRNSFTPMAFYADAPNGAHWAFWAIRIYGNAGQTPDLRFMEPLLAKMGPGQVEVPEFTMQPGAQRGANITEQSIAAGFTGQGALATLSQVNTGNIATSAISEGSQDVDGSGTDLGVVNGSWQTVADVNAIESGGVVILTWDVAITTTGFGQQGGYTLQIEWRVVRNGSVVIADGVDFHGFGTATFGSTSNFIGDDFDLDTGTNDYDFQVRFTWTVTGTGMSVHTRSAGAGSNLKAIGFKR